MGKVLYARRTPKLGDPERSSGVEPWILVEGRRVCNCVFCRNPDTPPEALIQQMREEDDLLERAYLVRQRSASSKEPDNLQSCSALTSTNRQDSL